MDHGLSQSRFLAIITKVSHPELTDFRFQFLLLLIRVSETILGQTDNWNKLQGSCCSFGDYFVEEIKTRISSYLEDSATENNITAMSVLLSPLCGVFRKSLKLIISCSWYNSESKFT